MGESDDGNLPTISSSGSGEDASPAGGLPQIEGFEITGKLGEGGMGTVWRAVQLSTHREVALKLMNAMAFGSDKAKARFEREVELAARLEHPNIARVYDSGLRRGVYYYAMELVDGVHLDQHVEAGGLTQRQILELMRTVAQAVQHAHQRGVIHRDLKPSNILVTKDGQPHVLDFGLAKAILEGEPGLTVSAQGDVAGTPAYMSPEQAAGQTDEIDTRSDVYSLGVILYRLLTGKSPHDLSGTRYEVLRRIAEEEVRRPRQVSKDIDKELESLLLKALAHDQKIRYASAGDLAEDIKSYLTGEPLAARTPTTIYFLHKRLRKHRVPVAIALIVIVALIGAGAYSYSRAIEARTLAEKVAQTERDSRKSLEAKQAEIIRARNDAESQRDRADKEANTARQAKEDADRQRTVAQKEADNAKREAESNRRLLYLSRVSLAASEYNRGNDLEMRQLLDSCPKDLRHWEWDFLNNLFGSRSFQLPLSGVEHGRLVGICLSPNGDRFLVGSRDGLVLFDSTTLKLLRRFDDSSRPIAFLPDGRRFLAERKDGKGVTLWDAGNGNRLAEPSIKILAISPNGRMLLSTSALGLLEIFDSFSEKIVQRLPMPEHAEAWCVSSDAQTVIAAAGSGWEIWDTSRHEWRRHEVPGKNNRLLALSENRIAVLLVKDDVNYSAICIAVYDTRTDRMIYSMAPPDPWVSQGGSCCMAFTPDGARLLRGDIGGARVFDAMSGKELIGMQTPRRMGQTLFGSGEGALSFSQDGNMVMAVVQDRQGTQGTLWQVRRDRPFLTVQTLASHCEFSPDSRWLLTSAGGLDVKPVLWDLSGEVKAHSVATSDKQDTWLLCGQDPNGRPLGLRIRIESKGYIEIIDVESGASRGRLSLDGTVDIWRMEGPSGPWFESLRGAAMSRDGSRLVVSGGGGYAVWDLPSRKVHHIAKAGKKELYGGTNGEVVVRYRTPDSPEEYRAGIFWGRPKVGAELVDAETGSIKAILPKVLHVTCVSKDGKWALAVLDGGASALVDVEKGGVRYCLTGQSPTLYGGMETILSSAILNDFSPDGQRFVTAEPGGEIRLWDTITGTRILTLKSNAGSALWIRFSPDGRYIGAAFMSGKIMLWDSERFRQSTESYVVSEGVATIGQVTGAFTKDDAPPKRDIASQPSQRQTRPAGPQPQIQKKAIGGAMTATKPTAAPPEKGPVRGPQPAQVDECLIRYAEAGVLKGHADNVDSIAFFPDGRRIASGSSDKTVRIWSLAEKKELVSVKLDDEVSCVALAQDGNEMATACIDGAVCVWTLDAKREPKLRLRLRQSVLANSVAFAPNGQWVISAGAGGLGSTVWLWNAGKGVVVRDWAAHLSFTTAAAFSPGGALVATCGHDSTVAIWDMSTGRLVRRLPGHPFAWVESVAFSPDGTYVVSGGCDGKIRLWDVKTGQPAGVMAADDGQVTKVVFSPSGRRIISSCGEDVGGKNTVQVWDAKTGRLLQTLKGHSAMVCTVAVSPDGRQIVSAGRDRTIRIWSVSD